MAEEVFPRAEISAVRQRRGAACSTEGRDSAAAAASSVRGCPSERRVMPVRPRLWISLRTEAAPRELTVPIKRTEKTPTATPMAVRSEREGWRRMPRQAAFRGFMRAPFLKRIRRKK